MKLLFRIGINPLARIVRRAALAAVVLGGLRAWGAAYYVDASAGSDSNSGLTTNAAWKTLTKVNATTFSAGDSILFKAGGNWTGQLNPKGSGVSNNPIMIDRYGDGSKPVIDGNGVTSNGAVYLFNQEYWEINNLEVINNAATEGDRRGIYLSASNYPGTVVDHLYVRNCYIHNIRGIIDQSSSAAKRTGGIIVEVINDTPTNGIPSKPTRFNDILIENCVISTVDNQGIALNNKITTSDYPGTPVWEARKFTHVTIRGNSINDVAKNAMIIRLTDETGLVEHNVCYDTAERALTGNTIFSRSCRGTVFQYNEGYLNKTTDFDGSLYDADLQSPGCIFQYSYSHDNNQGLFWQCTDIADTNVVVRYNISQNDKGIIFCMSYDCTSTYVYNNTVFVGMNLSPTIIDERRSGTKSYWFYNNIVYNLSPTAGYQWFDGNRVFDYNVFYGQHPVGEPSDAHKLTSDPKLVNPGSGGIGIATLAGYQLQAGSPCIDSGMTVPNNGGLDFWGNAVPFNSATDRGAHEWTTPASNLPPEIMQPPQSQTVAAGDNVSFSILASGTPPLAYQWRKSGTGIAGATNTALAFTGVGTNQAGVYDVVVTNALGAVTSAVAVLTVVTPLTNGAVVIAEVYNGGGKTGASYYRDFVVLKNRTCSAVLLRNCSLQHCKLGVWQTPFALPNVIMPPGGHYLISCYFEGSTNTYGDVFTADATTPQTSEWNLNTVGTNGSAVALVSNTNLPTSCADPAIVDLVGFISTTNSCYEGAGIAPIGGATLSEQRLDDGCQDTGDNAADFVLGTPNPRNSATAAATCIACPASTFPGQWQDGSISNSAARLRFSGVYGYAYEVQRSTNLASWAILTTNIAPEAGVFDIVDNFADLGGPPLKSFYRVRLIH